MPSELLGAEAQAPRRVKMKAWPNRLRVVFMGSRMKRGET